MRVVDSETPSASVSGFKSKLNSKIPTLLAVQKQTCQRTRNCTILLCKTYANHMVPRDAMPYPVAPFFRHVFVYVICV